MPAKLTFIFNQIYSLPLMPRQAVPFDGQKEPKSTKGLRPFGTPNGESQDSHGEMAPPVPPVIAKIIN